MMNLLLLAGCASLPQAPVGPVDPKANLELRQYKIRKHQVHVERSSPIQVSRQALGLSDLEEYFTVQGETKAAETVEEARREYKNGLIFTCLGTVALSFVGVGILIPYIAIPELDARAKEQIRPVAVAYNASLSRRWLGQSSSEPAP